VRWLEESGGGSVVSSATRAAALKSKANRVASKVNTTPVSATAQTSGFGYGQGYGNGNNNLQKNDRAGLKGKRGWAKKGGGGHGKYTWGHPGDDVAFGEPALSHLDPNYDSHEDDERNVIFDVHEYHQQMALKAGIPLDGYRGGGHLFGAPPSQSNVEMNGKAAPRIPLKEFKQKCLEIVDEYLTSEDVEELKTNLTAFHSPMLHYEFVRRAITLAMERNARERELVSVALSELYGQRVLLAEHCGKGFERLFEVADDLTLDIPEAKRFIAQFLARGVADELLPPSFLSDPLIERLGGDIIEQAKVLLSIKHSLVRLDHVWGTTSKASVIELKAEIKMILDEFVNSSDLDEACACIKRLNIPHFHHEVVKRAVVVALDCREREQAMMSSLLAELSTRQIVSNNQMEIGFRRLYAALPDLELDAPGAARILNVFLLQAVKDNCINPEAAKSIKSSFAF